jgi:putative hemin transport protein
MIYAIQTKHNNSNILIYCCHPRAEEIARQDCAQEEETGSGAPRRHWRALEDTREFSGLLQEFGTGRLQGLRFAGQELAYRVELRSLRLALEAALETQTPLVCAIGNRGCIQIHTGLVTALKAAGLWLNVLGPNFNLHMREDAIASAWVIRKPASSGIVATLGLFDSDGFCFAQLSGTRKPGKPQLENWKWIASSLPRIKD